MYGNSVCVFYMERTVNQDSFFVKRKLLGFICICYSFMDDLFKTISALIYIKLIIQKHFVIMLLK